MCEKENLENDEDYSSIAYGSFKVHDVPPEFKHTTVCMTVQKYQKKKKKDCSVVEISLHYLIMRQPQESFEKRKRFVAAPIQL